MELIQDDIAHDKRSKVARYRWEMKDAPGKFQLIDKTKLRIDTAYQRRKNESRIIRIAKKWSWIACGVLVVVRRPDGSLYVVDGQHRAHAAMKRSDIESLPCLVFESEGLDFEAGGWDDANTNRKIPTSLERWNPRLLRGDPDTVFANNLIMSHGREPSNNDGPQYVRCLTSVLRCVAQDRAALARVWPLISEVCKGRAVTERIIGGLFYIETHLPDEQSLNSKLWRERVLRVGAEGLLGGAQRASVFYSKGGDKVWASGMLEALNKGCRTHITIN